MIAEVYRYRFAPTVSLEDVEASLLLGFMAAESLYGPTDVRLDAGHALDPRTRVLVIDAATPLGRDLNRLFVGFVSRALGADAFKVERVVDHYHQPQESVA